MAKKLAFDRVLFTTVVILLALGLTMVFSASAVVDHREGGRADAYLVKQILAAAVGLLAMLGLMHLDYRQLGRRWVVLGLVGCVAALQGLALAGPAVNSSRRWLLFGGVSVQPSELAKLVLVVYLADLVARREERERERELLVPALLVSGLLAGLVLLGRDLGSAIMLGLVTALMLVLAGLPWRHLAGLSLAAAPVVALAILAEDYRVDRLKAFLDPSAKPLTDGFQASQSLIAIGSGGLFGLGLGQSLQKLHFLPYAHSDFVFSIVGEELGLVGALGVLGLFGLLLWRGVRAGLRAPDAFGRYLAWGLSGALTLQALIHVSVAVGLLPATGLTLPFVSYGGSSLVMTMVACGVLLNVSQHA